MSASVSCNSNQGMISSPVVNQPSLTRVQCIAHVSCRSICVGLATSRAQPNSQIGVTSDAFAYRADTGRKYHGSVTGAEYGPSAGTGDVIGCGWSPHLGEVFFTKNGEALRECLVCNKAEFYRC